MDCTAVLRSAKGPVMDETNVRMQDRGELGGDLFRVGLYIEGALIFLCPSIINQHTVTHTVTHTSLAEP